MLFLLLKNAKDSSYNSVILFDAVTGHTYRENSIKSFEGERRGTQEALISDVCHNYQIQNVIQLM